MTNDKIGSNGEGEIDSIIHITCHEVGHEWFCYGVGNDQGNEPWLDESFTSYIEYLYCRNTQRSDELYKNMQLKYFNYEEELLTGFYRDCNEFESDRIMYINLPVLKYNTDDYGSVVYNMGEAFLHSLEDEMGEEAFFEMLSDWYNDNLNGVADGYAFIQHVMEYSDSKEVKKIINTFISDEYLK